MEIVIELRWGFTIALVTSVLVFIITTPTYILAWREEKRRLPFVSGMIGLQTWNVFKSSFFFYVIWFDLTSTTSHMALLLIPIGITFRNLMHALIAYGAIGPEGLTPAVQLRMLRRLGSKAQTE